MSIKEKALKWWEGRIKKEEYVVSTSQIADQRQRQFLVKEKFLVPIAKSYWILKKPEDQLEEIFPLLYWEVIEKMLTNLSDWSIWGRSALTILSGEEGAQFHLSVKTKTKTNRNIELPLDYRISLFYDPDFDSRLIKLAKISGKVLPIDKPEKVLIDVAKLRIGPEAESFIAGTAFDLRVLEALYAKNPKPIVFKRLIGIVKDAGRIDLVAGLERIIETYTHYQVGRKENVDVKLVSKKPLALRPPWVIRQEQQIENFEAILEKELAFKIGKLKKHPLDKLITQAKEHKKYDTYHSTTLEGYRITPEEVEALLSGFVPNDIQGKGDAYVEKVKNRSAILGYSGAFDSIINKIKSDFRQPFIGQELVKDTYFELFKPSADAGLIDRLTLIEYRNMPAFIRGTPYVPPSYEKLPELMGSYESSINKIKNPVIKAILAHYLFVTIHPYIDGNGRTARLLMNYLLVSSGYQWITIKADQRIEYFGALKKAQVDNDILSFGVFIVEKLEESR